MHAPPAVVNAARRLAAELSMERFPPTCRLVESSGNCVVMVTAWDAREVMPTARSKRRPKPGPKGLAAVVAAAVVAAAVVAAAVVAAAVLDAIGAAETPLTTKEIARELRQAGVHVGASTLVKVLAGLTRAGELLNPRGGRGYRRAGALPNGVVLPNGSEACPSNTRDENTTAPLRGR